MASVAALPLRRRGVEAAVDSPRGSECGCAPVKVYLCILTFVPRVIFTCHRILLFFWFFPPLQKCISCSQNASHTKPGDGLHLARGPKFADSYARIASSSSTTCISPDLLFQNLWVWNPLMCRDHEIYIFGNLQKCGSLEVSLWPWTNHSPW